MAAPEQVVPFTRRPGNAPPIHYSGGASEALARLLEEAADGLDADIVAILLNDERLRVRHVGRYHSSRNAARLVEEIEQQLSEWLRACRSPTLINDVEAGPSCASRLSIACKLIVAPIARSDGAVEGIIVIGNPPSAPDFVNRNLVSVDALAAAACDVLASRFDASTGFMSRREFETVLQHALTTGSRSTTRHCLLHVDLDELQRLEESFGADARDELIAHIARELDKHLAPGTAIGRLGRDEFAVLLRDCTFEKGFCVGQEIRRAISSVNVIWQDKPMKLTASIGVTQLIPEIGTCESTLAAAKIACITAKELGRDQVKSFDRDAAIRLGDNRRARILSQIQEALQNDRFVLFGQIIRPLSARARAGHVEILLKGIDSQNELLAPSDFIPFAERNKIMSEIDRWVVRRSLEKIAGFQLRENRTTTVFSINLSGQTLSDDGFLDFVINELDRTAVAPRTICFEITETAAILNVDRATHLMTRLKEHGCLFSLDDFGAGLSSFSYLRALPVSYLKIDGQFVRDIVGDPICDAIVAAISQMSDAMGLKTIAEFVESTAIKQQVRRLGIDYAQGNAVATPKRLDEVFKELSGRH